MDTCQYICTLIIVFFFPSFPCPGIFYYLVLHFSVCFLNRLKESSKKMLVPITKARVASVLRYIAVSKCLEMTRDLSSHVPLTRVLVLCTVCTSFDPLNASLWRFIFRTELECNYTVFNDDRTIEIRVIQMQFTSLFVEFLYFDTDTVKTQYSETLSGILIRAANDPSFFTFKENALVC